jgi:predicted ATPase with chaperone activity
MKTESEVSGRSAPTARAAPAPAGPRPAPAVPPIPETLADTGLSPSFIADMLLRAMHLRGPSTGSELAALLRLPFPLFDELLHELQQRRLVEVRGAAGMARASYTFDVTHAGEERALASATATQYVGPAPVPLEQYREWVWRQSVHDVNLSREVIHAGFRHLVMSQEFLDRIGPAINSARSLFLWGEAGNGKTVIAGTIAALLGGAVFVPHAVLVEGQVVLVYDPIHHRQPHPDTVPRQARTVEPGSIWRGDGPRFDQRFVVVERPTVLTGGELTLEQLELSYDPVARTYQAPPQVKANGGVLILDDFGRQRVKPRALLNRWMIPLEQRIDYLALHTGGKFPMPFDCLLVFATNLDPSDLVEEAFLRRIRYKIEVRGPTRAQYTEMLRRCCEEHTIPFHPSAVEHIYNRYYDRLGIEPRACHPRDIVDHVCDVARYYGRERAMTPAMIDGACESYFLTEAR